MSVDQVLYMTMFRVSRLFKSYSKHSLLYWVIAAQKLIMVQSIAKIEGVDVLVLTQVGSDVSIPTAGLATHIHTHTVLLIIVEMLPRQEKRKDESMFY